ncbi:MAG TPA: hypothetical protein DCQ31_05210 [Bacteroidales bacterium]|nr:hypothetical protein [Bacteroidales bacterium]
MKNQKSIGNYGFPQAALVQAANQMVELMYRDQVEFAKYGVKNHRFAEINQLATELTAMLPDKTLIGTTYSLQSQTTAVRKELVQKLDEAAITVEAEYGKNSVQYQTFKFAESRLKAKNYAVFEQSVRVCTLTATNEQFANLNFPDNLLAEISELAVKLGEGINSASLTKGKQTYQTEARIQKANELYRKLIMLCSLGKRIWQSRSKPRYNEYVLKKQVKRFAAPTATAA